MLTLVYRAVSYISVRSDYRFVYVRLQSSAERAIFSMERDYDIFETLADGAPVWRGVVRGLEEARAAVSRLASQGTNEFFAIHTPTKEIVARAGGTSHKKKAANHT